MEQVGTVKQIIEREAVVLVRRASACGENCAHCKGGCTQTNLSARVENRVGAAVGDLVKIETDTKRVILAAVLLYFVPCLFAIACAVIAEGIGAHKTVVAIATVVAFVTVFCIIQRLDRRIAPTSYITKILSANNEKV